MRRVRRREAEGGWATRIELERQGDVTVPVEVLVRGPGAAEARRRADGFARRETLVVHTPWKPQHVVVDPDNEVMDWNRANNDRGWGFLGLPRRESIRLLDRPFVREVARDRPVSTWLPLAWYNDEGGLVVGTRTRSNQMGWLNLREVGGALAVRRAGDGLDGAWHHWIRVRNPPGGVGPRQELEYSAWAIEDRWGGELRVRRDLSRRLGRGPRVGSEWGVRAMVADTGGFLPQALWDDAVTLETWSALSWRDTVAGLPRLARLELGLGLSHLDRDPAGEERTAGFARLSLEAAWRGRVGRLWVAQLRAYAGVFADFDDFDAGLPRQRRIALAGAGPYETLWNPFVRSRGAIFRRGDVSYHAPGGPNLRGFHPALAGTAAAALNARAGPTFALGSLGALRLAAFGDLGLARFAEAAGSEGSTLGLWDAGLGAEVETQVLDEWARLRIDFPVYVNRPALGAMGREARRDFRWVFSFESEL